ncbi:MAG: hypothetical protein ABSH38_20975 [Verrucomicrobiota bacterium]
MRVDRNGLTGAALDCSGKHAEQIGTVGVGFFRRKSLRPLRGFREVQQGIIGMRFDGGVNRAAFQACAGKIQRTQFPFENLEAAVFGQAHFFHNRAGGGVYPAQLNQQLFQIVLKAGRPDAGQDFPNDGRRYSAI